MTTHAEDIAAAKAAIMTVMALVSNRPSFNAAMKNAIYELDQLARQAKATE